MNSNVAVVLDLMEAYDDGNVAALDETRDVLYHTQIASFNKTRLQL